MFLARQDAATIQSIRGSRYERHFAIAERLLMCIGDMRPPALTSVADGRHNFHAFA